MEGDFTMNFNIMKKLLATFLSVTMLLTPALAADYSESLLSPINAHALHQLETLSQHEYANLLQSVKTDLDVAQTYAYLDISTASPAAEELVLAARENIIFHNSWYDKNLCTGSVLTDPEGNIVRELPAFQDIFPDDWEIPHESKSVSLAPLQSSSVTRNPGDLNPTRYENVVIPYANTSTTNYAEVICKSTGTNTVGHFAVDAAEDNGGISFQVNLAIANMVDDIVTFVEKVDPGYIHWANGVRGYGYGMRVSTYDRDNFGLRGDFIVLVPEY